jgi:hypothetical protein
MPGAPNPEAIAWYLKKSEGLLGDLRDQAQSLRLQGAQLAGFSGAVLALAGANVRSVVDALDGAARACAGISLLVGALLLIASLAVALRGTALPQLKSDISVEEVANYASARFTHEPELWRIHVRTIRNLLSSIEDSTRQSEQAAQAVKKAELFFLVGLFSVGIALAILIPVVTF